MISSLRIIDSTVAALRCTSQAPEMHIILALPAKSSIKMTGLSLHVQQVEYPPSPAFETHCSDTAASIPSPPDLRRAISHQPAAFGESDVISLGDVDGSVHVISNDLCCAFIKLSLPPFVSFDEIHFCGILVYNEASTPFSVPLSSSGNLSPFGYLLIGHNSHLTSQDIYTSLLHGIYHSWCDRFSIFRAHDIVLQYSTYVSSSALQRSDALSAFSRALSEEKVVPADMTAMACVGQIFDSLRDTSAPSDDWASGPIWLCCLSCLDTTSLEFQLLQYTALSDFDVLRCTRIALHNMAAIDRQRPVPTFGSTVAVLPVLSRLGMVKVTDKTLFTAMNYTAAISVQLTELSERLRHLHPKNHSDLSSLVTACQQHKFTEIVHDINIVLESITMLRHALNQDDANFAALATEYQVAFESAATAFGSFAQFAATVNNAAETYETVLRNVVEPMSNAMRQNLNSFWDCNDLSKYTTQSSSSDLLYGGQVTIWAGSGTKGGNATLTSCRDAKFNYANGLCVLATNSGTPIPEYNENIVYVVDTLNHSIRALYCADFMVDLIAGTNGSGRLNGKLSEAQFSSPQGACTYTIPTATPTTIMVVADMNNGAIRGFVLGVDAKSEWMNDDTSKPLSVTNAKIRPNDVFTIAQPGQTNVLSKPTSVTVYQQKIIVCSRGNHTLQAYSLDKKGNWIGAVIAGSLGDAGSSDGHALSSARLTFPTDCCADISGVYFTEQTRSPSIRIYKNQTVTTIVSGAPLKNPSGICIGTGGNLFVCDRSASCVWSVSLDHKSVVAMITENHIPSLPSFAGCANASFSPAGIIRVCDGVFVFTDLTRQVIYRYMDGETADAAVASATELAQKSQNNINEFTNTIDSIISCGFNTLALTTRSAQAVVNLRRAQQLTQYTTEIQYVHAPLGGKGILCHEAIIVMIRHAPNLRALSRYLAKVSIPPDLQRIARENVAIFLTEYDFSSILSDADDDIRALSDIFRLSPTEMVGQEELCLILKNEKFIAPLSCESLTMIAMVLKRYNFSLERSVVADLRREVCRWLGRVLPGASDLSWTFNTHREVVVSALNIWSSMMHLLSSARNDTNSAFLWILRVHLDSICIGMTATQLPSDIIGNNAVIKAETRNGNTLIYTIDKALWTIYDLPAIVEFTHSRNIPLSTALLSVFADTCSDIIRTIQLPEVIAALLQPSNTEVSGECANDMSYVFQQIWYTVLEGHFAAMESRIYRRLIHNTKEEDVQLEDIHFEEEIILYEPDLWAGFLSWMERMTLAQYRLETKWWKDIRSRHVDIKRWFAALSDRTLKGLVTVDTLKRIATTKGLLYAWTALNSDLSQHVLLDSMVIEMQNALVELKSIVKVISMLSPESFLLPELTTIVNSWNSERICDVRQLLYLPSPIKESKFVQLPRILLDSLDWLLKNTESLELYRSFWNKHALNDCDYVDNLLHVRTCWCIFAQNLIDNKLSFKQLEDYYFLLKNSDELRALLKTCDGSWNIASDTDESVAGQLGRVLDALKKWSIVKHLYHERDSLFGVLDVASFFIEATALEGVATCRESLSRLTDLVKSHGDWTQQNMSFMAEYWTEASAIDPRILYIPKGLLEAMRDCAPTLTFLRLIQNDSAFTSSLEIALGLQEMECPPDLWDARSKRVNERYLSMLRNIRSYLYTCLYEYPVENSSFASFVTLYSSLNRAMDANVIAKNIRECHDVLEGLMQIIQNSSDSASQSRLMQLYSAKFDAQWRCVYNSEEINDCTLYLYYNASKVDNSEVWERHALPELLDFQSNIVLAKNMANPHSPLGIIMDKFLFQLSWMRRYNEALSMLNASGHFEYFPEYSVIVPVGLSVEDLKEKVLAAEGFLAQWTQEIDSLRRKHIYINYLDIKRCKRVYSCLENLSVVPTKDQLSVLADALFNAVVFISPSTAYDRVQLDALASSLGKHWLGYADMPNTCLSDVLCRLCVAFDETFASIPPYTRPMRMESDLSEYGTVSQLFPGRIYASHAPSTEVEYQRILTLYSCRGVFPQWQTCLVCTPHTTQEQIYNFIYRWQNHASFGTSTVNTTIFTIVEAHKLGYATQDAAIRLLREILSVKSNERVPLVLSCTIGSHVCPLVSQFQNNIIVVPTFPFKCIAEVFHPKDEIPLSFDVEVHTSQHAGAGKSFNIRSKASRGNYHYVYIPLNNALVQETARREFVQRVADATSLFQRGNPLLLHIDVASSVNIRTAGMIFQICVLGLVLDYKGETVACIPPGSRVCIELSASAHKSDMEYCCMMPMLPAVADDLSFQINRVPLQQGMGAEFSSSLFDGVRFGKPLAPRTTAADRLYFVLYVLESMRISHGTLSYEFDGTCVLNCSAFANSVENVVVGRVEDGVISSTRAFNLLVSAMKNKPLDCVQPLDVGDYCSLWCLWNFINVLYWQFKEMHQLESPLNSSNALRTLEEDTRMKRKIKGEVVQFIIGTAREFATRQTLPKRDPERIIGLRITGMSRDGFNQHWSRLDFDNDGQPCFQSGCKSYYFYFRARINAWVIDDIMVPSGSVYSSSQNADIKSPWTTSPSWKLCSTIYSQYTSPPAGTSKTAFRDECVEIRGCGSVPSGAYCSATEDGVYYRQPPYDDINDHPHYIKPERGHSPRRHLFYSTNRVWVVAPQCNEEQGFFVSSNGPSLICRGWKFIPPDVVEKNVKFQFIQAGTASGTDESQSVEENDYQVELLPWDRSNHECVLFNNEACTVAFLAAQPQQLRKKLHPTLLSHLEHNGIHVEGVQDAGSNSWKILSALTGVSREDSEEDKALRNSYCLTGDALLKILAIVYRIRCGVPVVLLGENGCGKTKLLQFLCSFMSIELFCLDVHGGITEAEIIGIFEKARTHLEQREEHVSCYVFLDEINTCAHMGLITEAVTRRTLNGIPLHENIRVLAALNPYRQRMHNEDYNYGLLHETPVIRDDSDAIEEANMKNLVYKVHKIPRSLKDFIFDFGALQSSTEQLYIDSILASRLSMPNDFDERHLISELISRCQDHIRDTEGDPSVVSLRDVQRCIGLINWFHKMITSAKRPPPNPKASPLCRSVILAIAHVYAYRQASNMSRQSLWSKLGSVVKASGKVAQRINFAAMGNYAFSLHTIDNIQRRFAKNLTVDAGIALNQALTENLFVTIVCILNKIPIFIVGRPGTSKTLAIQIIASNLLGKQSPHALWRSFPAVYIFQYQCSPLSTSASILFQYEAAKSYQRHSQDVITVLLLDEVGLAENSPDMPLKVLHYMLVEPEIAIVGLSNWALDSSKMNRAACLQRPEPSPEDIMQTGQNIVGSSESQEADVGPPVLKREESGGTRLLPWIVMLSQTFHSIYSNQSAVFGVGTRDFIGMRDYYSLLKQLRADMRTCAHPTPELLVNAISRNFGGNNKALQVMMNMYFKACFPSSSVDVNSLIPKPYTLIHDNLQSTTSRHLMVLSSNDSALHLLFGSGTLDDTKCTVLVGSRFKNDMQELHLIQEINQIKNAMAKGEVVVLLNNESIFESLYDVLNQRYVIRPDMETGQNKKMLRLALGPRSLLCPVEDGFKLVVIVNQRHAYEDLDLPLLNRFEKQLLTPADLLNEAACDLLHQLEKWCTDIVTELGGKVSLYDVFCGFYDGTLSSLCLLLTGYGKFEKHASDLFREAKQRLVQCAYPAAILRSTLLKEQFSSVIAGQFDTFSFVNSHLFQFISQNVLCDDLSTEQLITLTTKSPLSHFTTALATFTKSDNRAKFMQVINLAMVASEKQFIARIEKYLNNSEGRANCSEVLFVVSDPIECTAPLISHARYLLAKLHNQRLKQRDRCGFKNVVFIIHLPTGVRERQRDHILDFHSSWVFHYIDDLRAPQDIPGAHVSALIDQSVYDMFSHESRALHESLLKVSTSVVCRMQPPELSEQQCEAYGVNMSPIKIILALMNDDRFASYIVECVMSCLRQYTDNSDMHLHVQFACFDNALSSGSFRESLIAAVDSVVWQSLLHTLLQLDHDFNLHRLYAMHLSNHSDAWLQLARQLMDNTVISRSCILVPPSSLRDVNCHVANCGLHGTLVCQFPFSDRMIAVVNSIRERVESSFEGCCRNKFKHAVKAVDALLGLAAADYIHAAKYCDRHAYTHDFVSAVVHPLPHVCFTTHLRIVEAAIMCLLGAEDDILPSHAHSTYWICESEIFQMLCILSCDAELQMRFSNTDATTMEIFVLTRLKKSQQLHDGGSPVAYMFLEVSLGYLTYILDLIIHQLCSTDLCHNKQLVAYWCELYTKCVAPVRSLIAAGGDANIIQPLLEIWWRVTAAQSVLIEFNQMTAQLVAEENNEQSVTSTLLLCATQCSPLTGIHFQEFVQTCCDNSIRYNGYTHRILARFVSTFIFGELAEYEKLKGEAVLYSHDILHGLIFALNIADCAKHTGMDATSFSLLQRTIVLILTAEARRNNVAEQMLQSTFLPNSKNGRMNMLLYRNIIDDNSEDIMDLNVTLLLDMEHGSSIDELLSRSGCVLLRQVVQLRHALATYARCCVEALSATLPLPIVPDDVKEMLSRSELARVYFIKSLRECGGEAALLSYVKLTDPPFMPQGATALKDSDKVPSQLPFNPFPLMLGNEAYISACIALTSFCKSDTSSTSSLDNWMSYDPNMVGVPKEKRIALLLAAAFKMTWSSTSGHAVYALAAWLKKRTGNNSTSRQLQWIIDAKHQADNAATSVQAMMIQLMVHISLLCVEWPNSWLATLIVAPESMTTQYLPSLSSELAELAQASGYVSWYKCPNGHPYSVGECTYPMETARCPAAGCGALIGGQNHNAVKGVSRLGVGAEAAAMFAQPGYTMGSRIETYKADATLEVHILLLRYVLHVVMLLSAELCDFHCAIKTVANLVDRNKTVSNLNSTKALLQHRVSVDYEALKKRLNYADEDIVMGLHMVLAQWSTKIHCQTLPSVSSRMEAETEVRHHTVDVFSSSGRKTIEKTKALLSDSSGAIILGDCFGNSYRHIKELSLEQYGAEEQLKMNLFGLREKVTFPLFQTWFSLLDHRDTLYPVIDAVFKNERQLPYIHNIGSILAWHNFLYTTLVPSISREDASRMTNEDAVLMAPENCREHGYRVLDDYCRAFNDTFHLVTHLYECNPNPFLTSEGEVDLSGGGKGGVENRMRRSTILSFSLPSTMHGETDATGLCTIRLLSMLENAHNAVVQALQEALTMTKQRLTVDQLNKKKVEQDPVRRAEALRLRRTAVAPTVKVEEKHEVVEEEVESLTIRYPAITYRTPSHLIQQRLIRYSRDTTLMPIIRMSAQQSLEFGRGHVSGFDMDYIETELSSKLSQHAFPLVLQVVQYQFAGDIHQTGGMRSIGNKVTQTALSASVLDQIWIEIDTSSRLQKLQRLLEDVVTFIISAGGTTIRHIDSSMLLVEFVIDVILLPDEAWKEIECPTITQQVKLCHLQSLYAGLEARTDGQDSSGLVFVALKYREPLEEDTLSQVNSTLNSLPREFFMSVLHDFASDQLRTDNWPPDANLKEYLTYSSEHDLERMAWFVDLPSALQLRHIYSLYEVLSTAPIVA